MKNNRNAFFVLAGLFSLVFIPQIAYADSSWYWISKQRPFDLLPWVALATIAIEALAINFIPKTKQFFKTLGIVIIANLISFVIPYFIEYLSQSWYGSWDAILDSGPIYNVNLLFLILTLAAETPIVYNVLKRYVSKEKVLLWTIILSNIVTTIMVLVIEHTLCYGAWA
ncbi:hypothetical protein NE619_15380 [Anaerovorax odorimutans]|uniref:Uncharacterized protein n=1 Tax=Anaerovorax odorimutans TaxID=109327 RepID=A0ABT1RSD8_9FIRM|nr:hypothetical protein [Anaerovorax odorimutans]MCQ4638118.1 hypothetical protein [Anaerovorax odorimutans]